MMEEVFTGATLVAFATLLIALVLGVWRLLVGPSVADRVVALDFLSLVAIGFFAVVAMATEYYAYLDVAISLALVAFLATVALARFVFRRSSLSGSGLSEPGLSQTGTPETGTPETGTPKTGTLKTGAGQNGSGAAPQGDDRHDS